jgi:hypothetical protein
MQFLYNGPNCCHGNKRHIHSFTSPKYIVLCLLCHNNRCQLCLLSLVSNLWTHVIFKYLLSISIFVQCKPPVSFALDLYPGDFSHFNIPQIVFFYYGLYLFSDLCRRGWRCLLRKQSVSSVNKLPEQANINWTNIQKWY